VKNIIKLTLLVGILLLFSGCSNENKVAGINYGFDTNCRFKEQKDVSKYGNLVCGKDNICYYDYKFKTGEMLMTENCYIYNYEQIVQYDLKLGPRDTLVPADSGYIKSRYR
jgi:hypothetical protein